MFVLRRSSKEQFTTVRNGRAEMGHFPSQSTAHGGRKMEQNRRLVLLQTQVQKFNLDLSGFGSQGPLYVLLKHAAITRSTILADK